MVLEQHAGPEMAALNEVRISVDYVCGKVYVDVCILIFWFCRCVQEGVGCLPHQIVDVWSVS